MAERPGQSGIASACRWFVAGFGGWNRLVLETGNLALLVDKLTQSGAHFRSGIVSGPGGKQILVNDPSGNPVELFEPAGA